jgi:23S rRNA pseudouridine1911/1915/1917 synthase
MTSGGGLLVVVIIIIALLHVVCFGGIETLTADAASFVDVVSPPAGPYGAYKRISSSSSNTLLAQTKHHDALQRQFRLQSKCWAKPPPRLSFDLEAIEAFETQLEEEEMMKKAQHVKNGTNDDDDDDDDLGEEDEEALLVTIPQHLSGKRIDAALAELLQEQHQQLQQQVVLLLPGENLSRSFIGNLLSEKCIHLVHASSSSSSSSSSGDEKNNKELVDRKSFQVQAGQEFEISLSSSFRASRTAPTEIIAQDLALDILYEDEYMIVLNKAAHMVVHPAAGHRDGTVVNALQFYLIHRSPFGSGEFMAVNNKQIMQEASMLSNDDSQLSSSLQYLRPGIVHRLDKGTTGVLLVAKTQAALAKLSADFAARTNVKKTYLAITVGNPGQNVVIDKPIGRHPLHRQKMRVVPNHDSDDNNDKPYDKSNRRRRTSINSNASALKPGRRALSMVDTIAFDGKLSFVQVAIQTGRTHQIRVHLQDRHTPIYGDDVYGLADWNKKLAAQHGIMDRPLLHAYRLEVDHPVTGEKMYFQAPLPDDMLTIAKAIYPRSSSIAKSTEDEKDHDDYEDKVFPLVYTQRAAGKRDILE